MMNNAMQGLLSSILQQCGGQRGFNDAVNNLGNQCKQQGVNPEEMVRNMLNSGQGTAEQFKMAASIADMLTGRK